MRPSHQITRRVESYSKPIICAVDGLAFGGGFELVQPTQLGYLRIKFAVLPFVGPATRLELDAIIHPWSAEKPNHWL